jgi:hypothetical protein
VATTAATAEQEGGERDASGGVLEHRDEGDEGRERQQRLGPVGEPVDDRRGPDEQPGDDGVLAPHDERE